MKRIVLLLAILFSPMAFAEGTCDIRNTGLPDSVVQKLRTDCENLRLENITKKAVDKAAEAEMPLFTPERVTGWAQVAEGFANAMGAAAKQLNISVNEFITTPAGMITIGVILWKVIGVSILKFIAMLFVFMVAKAILKTIWKVGTTPVTRKFAWWTWTKNKPVYCTWHEAKDTLCGMSFLILAASGIAEVILLVSLVN